MRDEYVPVEDAAAILQVTTRQAHRYGEKEGGRIRTRKAGRRVMFHRGDVEALAADLGVLDRPRPQRPKTDLVPAGEMLDYIRERDQKLDALTQQLTGAAAEIGRLNGMLEQQRLLTQDTDELRRRVVELEAERDRLQAELGRRRPFWRRLFGK